MEPPQPPLWARAPRPPESLAEPLADLLALCHTPPEQQARPGTGNAGQQPVGIQHQSRFFRVYGTDRFTHVAVASNKIVCPACRLVQTVLNALPARFQHGPVRIARHVYRVAHHQRQPRERQVEREAAPGPKAQAAPRREAHWYDRAARPACQPDHAQPGTPRRPRRYIRRHRDVDAILQTAQGRAKRARAAAVLAPACRARTADQLDTETATARAITSASPWRAITIFAG